MTVNASNSKPDLLKNDEPIVESSNRKRNRLLFGFTLILLIIALILFCLWFFIWRFQESTDDAYANGNLVYVNSPINGSVQAFYADDTDLVVEGQLLVKLDPTYYQMAFDKAFASLESEVLQVKQLYDQVQVAEASVEVRKTNLSKTRYDFENRSALIGSKAISNEDYTHAQDELSIAENQLKMAEAELKVAQNAVGTTTFENHPRILEKKAAVKEAYYYLKHTSIYAPTTGYVAARSVNVGQTATPTKSLMGIVPADYVWVDANFKETQLKDMRIGQKASVWFDIYGSKVKFDGKVLGISAGSGSVFSIIPPQNATGNWIKIVQRLPVRLSLDPEMVKKYPIRLGLTANAEVDITNQDLPRLAQIPAEKPVATTGIYEISMEEIDELLEKAIR